VDCQLPEQLGLREQFAAILQTKKWQIDTAVIGYFCTIINRRLQKKTLILCRAAKFVLYEKNRKASIFVVQPNFV
jgi:hypothetical protein